MYKIDLVRRSVGPATSGGVLLLTFVRRCVFLTKVSAVACELGELSGDPWYTHQEAQGVRGVRRLQEWRAAESDRRLSWSGGHSPAVLFRR